jgi:hypothetical protein
MFPTYDQTKISDFSPQALTNVPGFNRIRKQLNAKRQVQVAECSAVWANFLQGKVNPFLMKEALNPTSDFAYNELARMAPSIFNEAMGLGDFTNLTTYVLDRMMEKNYATYPKVYTQFAKVNSNIRDFRTVERWAHDGGEGVYYQVGELEGFNRSRTKTSKWTYSVAKYEKGMQVSWEAVINDDMNTFQELPQRLVEGGVRTVEQFALGLVADSSGPHASLYGSAIATSDGGTIDNRLTNGATVNAPLSAAALQAGLGQLMNQATYEGRPINVATDKLVVMVGDGILYNLLRNILSTDLIATTNAAFGGASGIEMRTKNWVAANIVPVYAPELRNIVTSNLSTSWWIFAQPETRPVVEIGFLSGFQSPQLYRKLPNTVRVGGGSADELGDFEIMGTEFKGLTVFGGTRMDARSTVASDGTSS